MRTLSSLCLFLTLNVVCGVGGGARMVGKDDCFVYEVSANSSIHYNLSGHQTFHFGFLRLRADAKWGAQIFIYPQRETRNHLQVYILDDKVTLRSDHDDWWATSEKRLPRPASFPTWYYLKVTVHKTRLKVSRPESLTTIVEGELKAEIDVSRLEVKIASNPSQYVTLNCLAGCPIFSSITSRSIALSSEMDSSVSIHLATPPVNPLLRPATGSKERPKGVFNFTLSTQFSSFNDSTLSTSPVTLNNSRSSGTSMNSSSSFESKNHTCEVSEGKHKVIKLTKVDASSQNEVNQENGLEEEENQCHWKVRNKFNLTISGTENVNFSVGCNAFPANWTLPSPPPSPHEPRPSASSPLPPPDISVGEVAAWIVASLSLCALLVVGLTLYSKVSRTEWVLGDEGGINPAVSFSHGLEMLQYPKPKQCMFYAEIRKPDESSETQSHRLSAPVISDLLYPLDLHGGGEDDHSMREEEIFASIRSTRTNVSIVAPDNEGDGDGDDTGGDVTHN